MGRHKFFEFDKEEFLARINILYGSVNSGVQYSTILLAIKNAIEKNETQYILTTKNLKFFLEGELKVLQESLDLSIGYFRDYIIITNGNGLQLLKIMKIK